MSIKYKVSLSVTFNLIALFVLLIMPNFAAAQSKPISATPYLLTAATASCDPTTDATCPSTGIPQSSDPAVGKCTNQSNCDIIKTYVQPTLNLLTGLVGIVSVGSIVLAGIQYSSSGGDPQKAAKAKGRILNTILALVAYFFLYAFLQFIVPGGVFNRGS